MAEEPPEEAEPPADEADEAPPVRRRRSVRSTRSALSLASGGAAPRLYTPPTWMRRLLTNEIFLVTNATVIMLNVIWTGIAANTLVALERDNEQIQNDLVFFTIESLFSGCFMLELIVRLGYFASWRLWHDPWLCFDIVVIGCPAVEIWVLRPMGWNAGVTVTVMNIFRVFRVGRGVAMLANIKWFRPLYLSALGFRHSLNSLVVVIVYLLTLTFAAAILLCQLLGPSSERQQELPDFIRGRFRSVSASFLTLSECVLGGIEWGPKLVDVLLREDIAAGVLLLSFLSFAALLWLRTVAGVFMQQVDRSFEMINMSTFGGDKELLAATKAILKDFVEDLWEMDEDNSQTLSWRDISLVVTHHLELLADLGVRMPDAKRIFQELDVGSVGHVSISMYISRVQDSLKYKTVDTLLFENQQYRLLSLMKKLARLNKRSSKKVTDQLIHMSGVVEEVESEEPLQLAVQRRIAGQKQRVTSDQAWVAGSDATLATEIRRSRRASKAVAPQAEVVSGRGLVMDCWAQAVQRQRLELRDCVQARK